MLSVVYVIKVNKRIENNSNKNSLYDKNPAKVVINKRTRAKE